MALRQRRRHRLGQEQPGYKHIIIRPRPGNELGYAQRNYDSIHGRIATSWKRDGQRSP